MYYRTQLALQLPLSFSASLERIKTVSIRQKQHQMKVRFTQHHIRSYTHSKTNNRTGSKTHNFIVSARELQSKIGVCTSQFFDISVCRCVGVYLCAHIEVCMCLCAIASPMCLLMCSCRSVAILLLSLPVLLPLFMCVTFRCRVCSVFSMSCFYSVFDSFLPF